MSRPPRAELKREFEAVRAVLRTLWNPVGVDGLPADEYDSYVWPIVGLLREGADAEALARHIADVEDFYFAGRAPPERRAPTVAALLALGIKGDNA